MYRETVWAFIKEQFDSRTPRSLYFNEGGLSVYLRAGCYHFDPLDGSRHTAVGITNVNAREPGHGHFTAFLTKLEAGAHSEGYEFVRVEQVINPRLQVFLRTQGYEVLNNGDSEDDRRVCPVMFKSVRSPALQSIAIDPERKAFNKVWAEELLVAGDLPMSIDTLADIAYAIWRRAKYDAKPIADIFLRQTHVGTAWTYAGARGGLTFTSESLALADALDHGFRVPGESS